MQPDSTVRVAGQTVELDRKLGRHVKALLKVPSWLTQLVSFKTQQIMLGSTWNKMIAVFAIGIPACIVGGLFYSFASGRDLLTGFIQAYGALYKIPGQLPHTLMQRQDCDTCHGFLCLILNKQYCTLYYEMRCSASK